MAINIDLEGPYFDTYPRCKGILSQISFSYLDLSCMSQLFMTALMYDLILTSCILKKACLKHSNERAKLFHHSSLQDKGTHGFLWLLRNIWPTIPDRKPGVPDHHYSCLRRLDIFVWPSSISFLVVQGRNLKTGIAEARKYTVVRRYLEANNTDMRLVLHEQQQKNIQFKSRDMPCLTFLVLMRNYLTFPKCDQARPLTLLAFSQICRKMLFCCFQMLGEISDMAVCMAHGHQGVLILSHLFGLCMRKRIMF